MITIGEILGIQAVAALLATAQSYAAGDQVAPCAVPWADPDRLWEGAMPALPAIGWHNLHDGVRLNIRPFLAQDIPGGKKGAGLLRTKPNIKWEKDRGKEPVRDKAEFPWFYNGSVFTGDRVNDLHLTKQQKVKSAS